MNGNGPLDFDATIDGSQFKAMLDEMSRRIRGLSDTTVQEGNKIDNTFRNIGVAMAAYFSAGQLSSFVTQVADVRGEFQQLEISFETMLKNKAASDKLMAEVVQFATTTPFDLKGVASGAKQLLAYGTAAEDIIDTMRQLGDVAAGLSIPFNDLVYLYGTSATQGKLMTKDLMQFAGRGIPIIEELSKVLNVSKAEVMDLATKGEIHFGLLQEVIANLTNETGMFGNMMEKQSKSIAGLRSNLGDAWDNMLNDIGRANQETIEGTVRTAISVVENYQKVADILKVIIATYGSYRAAILLNAVAMGKYAVALDLVIIKQNLVNIAQKANPYGLALAGITALVGGLWAYNRSLYESKKALYESNGAIIKQVYETEKLVGQLKKGNLTEAERLRILAELKKANPEVTDAIEDEALAIEKVIEKYEQLNLLTRAKTSIDTYKADVDFQSLIDDLQEAEETMDSFKIRMDVLWVDVWSNFENLAKEGSENVPKLVKEMFQSIVDEGLDSEQAIDRILKKREAIFSKRRTYGNTSTNENEYYDYFAETNKVFNSYKYGRAVGELNRANQDYSKTIQNLEKFIDNYVDSQLNLNEAQKEDLRLKLKIANIPNFKKPTVEPETTVQITVLEKIKQLRKDILEQEKVVAELKNPSTIFDAGKINEAEEALSRLRKELEQIAGKQEKKEKTSFEDLIKEAKDSYENYYRWVARYGQMSADEQYENLIKGGKSYLEYLDAEIARLENKTKRSVSETENLNLLIAGRADLIGEETSVESFKKKIENTKEGFKDIVDYIEFIKAEIENASKFSGSEQELEKTKFLLEELASAEKQFVNDSLSTFQNLMKSSQDYAQQRLNAEQEYQETIKKLDAESLGENYQKAADEANNIRLRKLEEIQIKELEGLEAYKKLSGDLTKISKNEANEYIKLLENQLSKLDNQTEAYRLISELVTEVKEKIKTSNAETLSSNLYAAANSLSQIISLTVDANSEFGKMANVISSIIGNLGNATESLSKAFKVVGTDTLTGKKTYDVDFASGLAGFTSIASIAFTVTDMLDKQFGVQKRIADIEKARAEYNTSIGILIDELNEKLAKQMELLENMPKGQSFTPTSIALRDSMKEAQKQLEQFKFTLQNTPKEIDIKLDIGYIKYVTGITDNLEALRKAFADGIISEEQYNLAVEYIDVIEEGTKRLNNLQREFQEYITGTTSNALVDQISQLFAKGKVEAKDFTDTFRELMRDAIMQNMKMKLLEPALDKWYQEFSVGLMGGGLNSQSWVGQMQIEMEKIFDSGNEYWEAIRSLFPDMLGEADLANSLSGSIKGVSEETAGLIAGQMNAIRMNQATALGLMDDQLLELSKIEYNTRNNIYIRRIYDLLESGKNDSFLRNRANGGS
ncbi:MAG: tape measure protein [Bacteroidales bacterium]|nr:tape measure protein [Bacteroidales bacterium]